MCEMYGKETNDDEETWQSFQDEGTLFEQLWYSLGISRWLSDKESARQWFNPWVGKIPWRRAWQATLVSLPGESHRQRSLVGYNPKGWT